MQFDLSWWFQLSALIFAVLLILIKNEKPKNTSNLPDEMLSEVMGGFAIKYAEYKSLKKVRDVITILMIIFQLLAILPIEDWI